jgi:RNA polymerase sigma factor (sigma-70 family)
MSPPPAEPFSSRIFLGPALRTQPDRRLVKLVREGYEAAFEEIVRRYRRPLDRFAAAIVGNRSEDITQDAFSKALLALRGSEKEIELRPWLYRIVRNTALNDLRNRPPAAEELGEAIAGGAGAAVEAERHEEIAELMERLRALPEPQRAAIVMRELEGLSHEEIAAALGVSGGAARQAIYRARLALRDGLGLLIPLPLLRLLFDHGAEAAGAGGAAAAAGAASAVGGGATLGGLSSGAALKVGVATALVAGSVGAGVAVQQDRDNGGREAAASTAQLPDNGGTADSPLSSSSSGNSGPGSTSSGPGGNSGPGGSSSDDRGEADDDSSGRGRGRSGDGDGIEELDDDRSDEGTSGGSHSGHSGSGGDDDDSHSDSGSRGSGSSGSGSSGGSTAAIVPPPTEPLPDDDAVDSSGSGSGDLELDDSSDSSGPGSGEG